MNKYPSHSGVSLGDTVEITDGVTCSSGFEGVVTEIRDAMSPQARNPIVFEVSSATGRKRPAYAVRVVTPKPKEPTVADVLTDDQLRRFAALSSAVVTLPANTSTDDYITAASWIEYGRLHFTAELSATEVPDDGSNVEVVGSDDRDLPMPDSVRYTDREGVGLHTDFYTYDNDRDYVAVLRPSSADYLGLTADAATELANALLQTVANGRRY